MKKMIMFVCLSIVVASIMSKVLSDDDNIKDSVKNILLLESDVVHFENPPQSKEDALRELSGNDTEKMLKIVDTLKDFVEAGYKCKENKEPKWLAESAIYCLGELRSKSALELLYRVLKETNDKNMKYDCAIAILQVKDDPVPFIGEILSGNIFPEDFQYMGSLIEKIQNIYKEEAKKTEPNKKLLDGIKEALLKYVSAGKGKTTYLLNADYVLCAIDSEYKKSDSRKKALENIFRRKEALNDIQKQCIEKELKSFETSP